MKNVKNDKRNKTLKGKKNGGEETSQKEIKYQISERL